MMHMPTWKAVLIVGICLLGLILCIPNFFTKEQLDKVPGFVPSRQIGLGLDLKGGAHFLLEVGIAPVMQERLVSLSDTIRAELRKEQIRFREVEVQQGAVVGAVREPGDLQRAMDIVRRAEQGLDVTSNPDGSFRVIFTPEAIAQRKTQILEQSIEILRRRVDESGTKEPTIVRQGDDRILLQLPGVKDTAPIKAIIGKTAKMEFRLVNENVPVAAIGLGGVPPNSEVLEGQDRATGGGEIAKYVVFKRIVVGGESLTDAQPTNDRGQWIVNFKFDNSGGRRFCQATTENVQKRLAIVLDSKVISAPVIQSPICGGQGIITGQFTVESATELALLLRAGALPASLTFIEERTVGPELGADSIQAGEIATAVGSALVVVFMLACYGMFGAIAIVALFFNLVWVFAAMSVLGASLTLPGIAGIVLTVGMSVDANVLIYERVREEVRMGRTPISALDAGYERAMSSIVDGNLTTLISGIILFALGSGPIRGFAVTLSLGIIVSMFTAIMLTRLIIVWWLRWQRPTTLNI
ncbi:MAG: secD [Alphaproteobacteria bacterium]|jgi:preprotein translocase subunit SecD|nr:secD [Alphaproteobacteria bacterium]